MFHFILKQTGRLSILLVVANRVRYLQISQDRLVFADRPQWRSLPLKGENIHDFWLKNA